MKRILTAVIYMALFIAAMASWDINCNWWRCILGTVLMGLAMAVYCEGNKKKNPEPD